MRRLLAALLLWAAPVALLWAAPVALLWAAPVALLWAAPVALLYAAPAVADPLADLVAGRTAAGPELAGLAVVVAGPNAELRAAAYGAATKAPARALTADTPVRIASISKLVTAIGVMRLVETGQLELDRDVSDYLGWRLRNPAFPAMPVTLRQLLSHTAGIEDGPGYSFALGATLQANLGAAHWADAVPGTRFSYANLNYGIVASVMEAATHTRFDRLMALLVFTPLRLDACFNWSGCSDAAVASTATLYRKSADDAHWDPAGRDSAGPWVAQVDDLHGQRPSCPVRGTAACDLSSYVPGTNGTLFSPQGGLRISARGLAKIGRLLLRGGEVDAIRLLEPASVATLLTPQWVGQGASGDTYAGLMRCYSPGLQCLVGGLDQPIAGRATHWWGHLGEAYGLYGGLWIDPERQRVMVYLITGVGDDPKRFPGQHSKFNAFEEVVLTELAR